MLLSVPFTLSDSVTSPLVSPSCFSAASSALSASFCVGRTAAVTVKRLTIARSTSASPSTARSRFQPHSFSAVLPSNDQCVST